MYKPIELFIGARYTRAKRRNHFISFISLISMGGIALGITVLITVLSVMNGFEKELRERTLGVVSHLTISGRGEPISDWQVIAKGMEKFEGVVGTAPYVQGEGMFYYGSQVNGTLIRGVLPEEEPKVSEFNKHMLYGTLDNLVPGQYNIIIGKSLASTLNAAIGDKITLIIPQANVTPAGIMPRMKRFNVVGVFETGTYIYDSGMALLHMDDAATLFRTEGKASGVRVKLEDMLKAPGMTKVLREEMPAEYFVSDWTHQNANFFRAVQMEKTVMFIILLLIVAVAAFNIVSTLVMMVTDKQSDIAIMRTLGLSPFSIMKIFVVQGMMIGVIGTIAGTVGGVALALNVETIVPAIERAFSVEFLAADVYYISELPSDLRWPDVIKITTVSFLLTIVATLYPAWRASRTQPAETLRYE